jgi:hypothetical protein
MRNSGDLAEKIFLKGWRPYFWIVLLVFLIYFQTLFFNFTYFDDDILILNNQKFISRLDNILPSFKEDVFLSVFDIYYRPILNVSFIIDAQFGDTGPFVYHLTNILIHALAAGLVFYLLNRLYYRRALAFFSASFLLFTPPSPKQLPGFPAETIPYWQYSCCRLLFFS